jgi:very-short-patch-repair endonuclease
MPIKNIIPGQIVTKEKLQRAKELRRDMTPAEKILWQELRGNKLGEKTIHEFFTNKRMTDSNS